MILTLAFAALLQTATPPPDIVVHGDRDHIHAIDRQIQAILPPVRVGQPLARFQTAICPGVIGLAPVSGQAVVDRIGIVADTLGLPVGEPGCAPNLLLIVTDDARTAVRRFVARRQGNFVGQTLADIHRLHGEEGAARGWSETETLSRDGERQTIVIPGAPQSINFGVPILSTWSSGRSALAFRRDIISSVVVIDTNAARGRDTVQIADYAALRGLAGIRSDGPRPARSILAAFTSDGDTTAPPGLTDIDWGILRGLYTGHGNRSSELQRGEMLRAVLASGDRPADRCKETPLAGC